MVWRMATGAGNGALRMEPSGAATTNGASEPALFGIVRPDDAPDAEHGVGGSVVERYVDSVPGAGRGAGEVGDDGVVGHPHGGVEHDLEVVAVEGHAVAVHAVRHLGDGGLRGGVRGVEDVGAEGVEVDEPELAHHLQEPASPDVAARDQCIEIAFVRLRRPRVRFEDPHQHAAHLAAVDQLHRRDEQPFVVHVAAVRPHAKTAEVVQVRRAGGERHRTFAVEDRRHKQHIVQVPGRHPRIVGRVDVALAHGVERDVLQHEPHRGGHGVDVTRGAGDRLGEHAAVGGEYPGRDVAALAHERAEGGADEDLGLLLHYRLKAVPHHLVVDGGATARRGVCSTLASRRRLRFHPSGHHDVSGRIHARLEARRDEGRGLGLDDEGGAANRVAEGESLPPVAGGHPSLPLPVPG